MILSKLNPREQRLALVLAGVAFLIVNLLFLPQLTASNHAAKQRNIELKSQLTAAESWIHQEAYWKERAEWLEKTEPELTGRRRDSATQLEELQKRLQESGLALEEVQLLQLPETEFYQPIGATITISGPWSGLVHFLAETQTPEQFVVTPRFSIKSDQEPPNIHCEMEIQRWFHSTPEVTE